MILQTLFFESLKGAPVVTPPPALVEPDNQLFEWTFSDNGSDFEPLTGLSSRKVISLATEQSNYKHHIYGEELEGRLYCMHSVHFEDEEGIGLKVVYEYSDDDGETWSGEIDLFPEQSIIDHRENNTGRIVLPMDFANIDGELFGVADVNYRDFVSVPAVRDGLGIIARQIFPDGTLGDIFWIHNADGSENPVAPVSGFPQYQYSSEIREKVYAYLDRPNFRPKTNFSDLNLSVVDVQHPTYGGLAEPVTIQPEGYEKLYTYWKNNGRGHKIEQINDGAEFGISEIPDPGTGNSAIVTRFWQYNSETIFISGNSDDGNRCRLFFAISKRRSSDGVYVTEHVYNVDYQSDVTQQFPGHGKGGGPQIVDMLVRGNKVYFFYDIKKEDVYMKFVNLDSIADTTAPVITLSGGNVTIEEGIPYSDPGFSASDNIDGDITANVILNYGGLAVNDPVAGVYTVTYNVSDAAGNAAVQKSRTVTVEAVGALSPENKELVTFASSIFPAETTKYYFYEPEGTEQAADDSLPCIIHFHGLGEFRDHPSATTEAARDALIWKNGPPKHIQNGDNLDTIGLSNFIVYSPQQPYGTNFGNTIPADRWNDAYMMEIYNIAVANPKVDPNKVFFTGLSMGAMGALRFASQNPSLISKVLVTCPNVGFAVASVFETKPLWIIHGTADATGGGFGVGTSNTFVNDVKTTYPGAPIKYTRPTGVGHDSWTKTFNAIGWPLAELSADVNGNGVDEIGNGTGNNPYVWLLS